RRGVGIRRRGAHPPLRRRGAVPAGRHDAEPHQAHDGARRPRALPVHPQPDVCRARRALPRPHPARERRVAVGAPPGRARARAVAGDRTRRGVPGAQVWGPVSGLQGPRAAMDLASSRETAFCIEQFRDYLALEAGNSSNTVENYVRDIRRLVTRAAAQGARGPDEITAAQLREFIYDLKDLGLSPATIRRQISAVRTYYRFLVGEGRVTRDPSERVESPRQWRRLPSVLTVAEVERLLAAPNTDEPLAIRDRPPVDPAFATGARVSELVALRPADLLYADGAAPVCGNGAAGGSHEARRAAHAAPHVRHAPARRRGRPARRAGNARARGPGDHPTVHARGPRLPADRAQELSPATVIHVTRLRERRCGES